MKRLVIAIAFVFYATFAIAQQYTVTDLGTLGGNSSMGYGVNASGQVVGTSTLPGDSATHAFLYSNGSMTDLGTLGGTSSRAYGINASGEVIGGSDVLGNSAEHGFRYSQGTMTDLGTLGGGFSRANGINDSGQVVGASSQITSFYSVYAFRYSGGTMTNLGTLGGTSSAAYGINAAGEVVGTSTLPVDIATHAFLYNGSMIDLGTLGGASSEAYGININGNVVGYAWLAGNPVRSHAFLYSNGSMTDLGTLGGTLSWAYGINVNGDVVGQAFLSGDFGGHAFLYSSGKGMIDLNTLISSNSGWELFNAMGINDSGQITGSGLVNGSVHAYLLTPIVPYKALVQPPISADGTSTFRAGRGVLPVKFVLYENSSPTCNLPPATISVTRNSGATPISLDESSYSMAADRGSTFRIDPTVCQYIYNIAASNVGVGTYRVDISINGVVVGSAVFALQ